MTVEPRFVLGTAPLSGGLFRQISVSTAHSIVGTALAEGVAAFDTAPMYGLGEAELRLGSALRGVDRAAFEMHTKVGRPIDGRDVSGMKGLTTDFSYESVMCSVDGSLRRLELSHIDVLYLHDPQPGDLVAVLNEALPALRTLQSQGVVGRIGIASNDGNMATPFVEGGLVDLVMCAGSLTLLDHSADDSLLPAVRRAGVPLFAAGVFNSGVLATPDKSAHFEYAPAAEKVVAQAQRLAAICEGWGVPLGAAALQFPLVRRDVARVVVGVESSDELLHDLTYLRMSIPDGLWRAIAPELSTRVR